MIEFLSGWAKNLGVVIVIVSIFEMILPNNKTKKYIRVVLGIFVMFNIISPFIKNKDKLSSVSIDLENYTTEQNVTVDQTSMDKRIQDLYEKELEKDIKNKIEEQGYKVASCKVNATILENENSNSEENTIQKIKLKIEKKKDIEKSNQDAKNVENKIVTEIQKIKKVNTTIGNNTNNEDTNNKETDTNNFKKITRQDIQDIKKFIIDEYGVKEKCLEIN
jgi:stage III sporulation protein AF